MNESTTRMKNIEFKIPGNSAASGVGTMMTLAEQRGTPAGGTATDESSGQGQPHQNHLRRMGSFTPAEEYVLRKLLLDPSSSEELNVIRSNFDGVCDDIDEGGNDIESRREPEPHEDSDQNNDHATGGITRPALSEQILFSVLPPCFPVLLQTTPKDGHGTMLEATAFDKFLRSEPKSFVRTGWAVLSETNEKGNIETKEKGKEEIRPVDPWSSASATAKRLLGIPLAPNRPSIQGLWRAHSYGVPPRQLVERGTLNVLKSTGAIQNSLTLTTDCPAKCITTSFVDHMDDDDVPKTIQTVVQETASQSIAKPTVSSRTSDRPVVTTESDDTESNIEVRPDGRASVSDDSSWDEKDHREHYDTWEVLKDEYAEDFGFDYCNPRKTTMAEESNVFQILGTSADDKSAQPHVLSPPLMDALMNHLPPDIIGQNYWLKFSLVRDGASLDTLKQYVRAAKYTILAIETPSGQVFGSFTCHAWRNQLGFYGIGGPSFVWSMKQSRQTPCSSLFDQAQLESDIYVYPYVPASNSTAIPVQVCRNNILAVGGDDRIPNLSKDGYMREENDYYQVKLQCPQTKYDDDDNNSDDLNWIAPTTSAANTITTNGFAIALERDLLLGTTSPCRTYASPALCGTMPDNKTEIFEVAGLEIWGFTPAFNVDTAEKLEMTKYFVEQQSTRSLGNHTTSEDRMSRRSSLDSPNWISSRDLDQRKFFQRVGYDNESEKRHERWQYLNLMSGGGDGTNKGGLGPTPRFA